MSFTKEQLREQMLLYAVTDRHWLKGQTLYEQVEEALKGGATFIQLREKDLTEEEFLEEAKKIQQLCKKYRVPFIINDNVKLAKEIDADGVHVGQSDMEALDVRAQLGEDKIIGVSARTVEQALLAEKHGADYLGVGAVFQTGTKTDAREVEHSVLKEICTKVDIPVVAIGGITQDNVKELSGSGINGVAVISAIFAQKDIETATAKLKSCVEQIV
ncbi:thiamine-phosphate diphosphorylase [[Ruminococcus] torques L2-14]|uniref:Thiamine-phosphate synthase n=1 Tax=[Ruminococcus] torques L2-14 TaxID=657313 RepID=D4M0X0_9FIRM|nr:thiamine phosphate synthase [[Ruminococcus] torques]CBL24882.1 thiamine-phosphate diphosphorylase [[Ruminococcus] torques L2-14]